MRWHAGEEIVLRYLDRDGAVEGARPLRVIRSDGCYVALFMPEGTSIKEPVFDDGRAIRSGSLREQVTLPRRPASRMWRDGSIVMLVPRAGAHSVWVSYDSSGAFAGWYVNLERPHRFAERAIETRDHVLDLCVAPDRSWRWKDEEELAAAIAHGFLTPAEGAETLAEGQRVIDAVDRWARPYCDGWEDWRPDPSWPQPELPADWDLGSDDQGR